MGIKTVAPSKQQVDELRNMFIEKYAKNPPSAPFHAIDIDRVRNDDVWCTHFLEMYDLDLKVSFEKLWSVCIWRQQYGANDLNESNVRMDYLTDGVIFQHNKDIDGKPLLIFKTKLHVKGAKNMDDVLKVLVYWIERMHRETHMDKCTLFFDMDGTGLSNMDLEFIKMIIETFKLYYPNALNYIIVFEMAWVLNAAFKIVKTLLPEKAVEILKIIKKKDINQYIDKDNCLASWGGNDDYQFSFVPEKRIAAAPAKKKLPNSGAPAVNDDFNNNISDKKVHFAKSSLQQTPAPEQQQQTQMHDIPDHFTPQDYDMMQVSPRDFLKFSRGDAKESILELTSTSQYPVTYKIQTTSPEKFRVRPRIGILNPGETVAVNILLKPEHNLSDNAKDKFLIMCLPAVDVQTNQNADFWKKLDNNALNVEQHRLCCVYKDSESSPSATMISNGYSASSGDKLESSTKLSEETRRLEKQLRNTQILQLATLIIVIILSAAVIYLLKLQFCNEDGCLNNEEAANNVDFGSCAKGKADL